jgi:hypothetical protein
MYTLHTQPYNAFMHNTPKRTALVCFKREPDAAKMGRHFEAYFLRHKHWPQTLTLPLDNAPLDNVFLKHTSFNEILNICALNNIDMTIVSKIQGSTLYIEKTHSIHLAPLYYKDRLEELFHMNDPFRV